jgi:hypothetical protein
MHKLLQVFPDASALVDAKPEQLGAQILLLVLKKGTWDSGLFLPRNLNNELWPLSYIPGHHPPYPLEKKDAIEQALSEAWAWLERQGLIVPAPESSGPMGWRCLSRRAERVEDIECLAQAVGPSVLLSGLTTITGAHN